MIYEWAKNKFEKPEVDFLIFNKILKSQKQIPKNKHWNKDTQTKTKMNINLPKRAFP